MALIKWDESFSVGNTEIDEQHKKWIAIYNNMHEGLTGGGSSNLANLAANSLEEMHDYAKNHFQFEEEYLKRINYPELVDHRRLHRDFENKIYNYTREIRDGKILLNTSIIKMIRNWLVEHILQEDKKYSDFALKA